MYSKEVELEENKLDWEMASTQILRENKSRNEKNSLTCSTYCTPCATCKQATMSVCFNT